MAEITIKAGSQFIIQHKGGFKLYLRAPVEMTLTTADIASLANNATFKDLQTCSIDIGEVVRTGTGPGGRD